MVTIKKIEIKNYFGRGDFEWTLDPVVNILGGKNGSGKSSVFKLCYLLLTNGQLNDNDVKRFSGIFGSAVLTFSNGWSLAWSGSSISILDEKGVAHTFQELQRLIRVFLINSFEQQAANVADYDRQPKSLPLDDPTMLDLMIKDQIDLRNRDFSKTMENFVDSLYGDEAKHAEYVMNYKKIYESLGHFLQGYDKPFNSSFEFSKDGKVIGGYEHLSMGEKQILLLLLMVANTNQQPCIFLMDEPDLSMHIDWKEILVKELHELNPNMQIILSTHAPSVITGWHDKVREVDQLIKGES